MILREAERIAVSGERIAKIASSFSCVPSGTPVYDLLSELKEPYQHAIAVVDSDLFVLGIIVPQDLVEILGKPFGRDLLKRQKADDIMRKAVSFRCDEYIEEIQARIAGDLETELDSRYVLVDRNSRFCGHVSSHDILVHALADHRREMETAAAIQNRLVPPCATRRSDRVSITCSAVMAQEIGGDFYYSKEYAGGKWFFCLCDISGKGTSAAIITAVVSGFLYDADFSRPLDSLVTSMNTLVLRTFNLEKYLTGFFARFDEKTGELEYCDMGHSWFYAIENARIQQITETADNVPVGLLENPSPVTRTLRLAPGTVLAVLSDGFTEQEDTRGSRFEIGELGPLIQRSVRSGEDLVRAKIRILERFYSFKKDMPQHDDISMLLFHYLP